MFWMVVSLVGVFCLSALSCSLITLIAVGAAIPGWFVPAMILSYAALCSPILNQFKSDATRAIEKSEGENG